jgi:hypothetical protein
MIIFGPILHSQFEKVNECILKIFSLNENTKYDGIFENTSFVKMESSKLIIYLTNMCQSGQGIMVNTSEGPKFK